MFSEFNKENISLPISMPKAILNAVTTVRAAFTDKNIYNSTWNYYPYDGNPSSTTTSAISAVASRTVLDSNNTITSTNYNKIKGFIIVIGY